MRDANTSRRKQRIAVKIIIPVLLLCVVFGIWLVKNNKKGTDFAAIDKPGSVISDDSNLKSSDSPDLDLHVIEKIDLEKLKSYEVPIVIDFGADSCIPCKEMAPILKELNSELKGKAIIKFVDVWKYQELAEGYPLSVIPTQILINADGKPYKPSYSKSAQFKQYSRKDTGEHVFTAHEGGMTKEQILSVLKEMGLE